MMTQIPLTLFHFKPLPEDKILALPELKAFADDKCNVAQLK